jgi:hypothetical protein
VQVGGAIGLAVLATLATERTDGLRAAGEPAASALNAGFHVAYLVGAALVAVAIVIAVAVLRGAEGEPDAEREGSVYTEATSCAAPQAP